MYQARCETRSVYYLHRFTHLPLDLNIWMENKASDRRNGFFEIVKLVHRKKILKIDFQKYYAPSPEKNLKMLN